MAFKFLNDYTGFDIKTNFRPLIKDGRFSLVNKMNAIFLSKGVRYAADLELVTNFESIGKNVEVKEVANWTDFSGYNKKFVSEDGVYNPLASLEEFSRLGYERGLVNAENFEGMEAFRNSDSHESFLLNCLISWMKADMYKSSGGTDKKFWVKVSPYADSHAVIKTATYPAETRVEIALGPPVSDDDTTQSWVKRDMENYWERQYILYYNAQTIAQETFYLTHVLGRTKNSPLNFEVNLNSLDTNQLLLHPTNRSKSIVIDTNSVPWDKPEVLWNWILDYVYLNRLQQQFAAALEVLSTLVYHPKWTSAEGCMWGKSKLVVSVAEFCPTRARFITNLQGDAYYNSSLPIEFIEEISYAPSTMIANSAMINYYMWYGAYVVMLNKSLNFNDPINAFLSVTEDDAILNSYTMRAGLMSLLTGQEIPTCMTPGLNVMMDLSMIAESRVIDIHQDKDGTYGDSISIEKIYAPVSGSLILGSVACDAVACYHLQPVQKLNLGGVQEDTEYSAVDVHRLANAMRLFGYDTIGFNTNAEEEFTTWAPVHDLIVELYSVSRKHHLNEKLLLIDIVKREGRNHTVPSLTDVLTGDDTTLMITKPNIKITEYGSRTRILNHYRPGRSQYRKEDMKIKVRAGYAHNVKTLSAKQVQTEAGFRLPASLNVPEIPSTSDQSKIMDEDA